MRTISAAGAFLLFLLASAPRVAACGFPPYYGYGCPPPVPGVIYGYQPYAYPSPYWVQPAPGFNTWWDPDYRALRYNRYFQRYQEPPRIQGFTLR